MRPSNPGYGIVRQVPGKSIPNLPQAPVITSKNDFVTYMNGEYVWMGAKTNEREVKVETDPTVTVRILHSQVTKIRGDTPLCLQFIAVAYQSPGSKKQPAF